MLRISHGGVWPDHAGTHDVFRTLPPSLWNVRALEGVRACASQTLDRVAAGTGPFPMTDETRERESYEDECNELRTELIRVVQAHPGLMISQIIGILEILKADMVERIPKSDA